MKEFLETVRKQFQYYQLLGEKCFDQLSDEQLFFIPAENSNSIAVIVNHLSGNMKSRWTDFLNSDGEKEWRHRDREFEQVIQNRSQLTKAWYEGWDCLFSAIDSITEEDYDRLVYIRKEGHTIQEALLRQHSHYAYHVGQIVFLGRLLKGNEWTSLSIPKNGSKAYNAAKNKQEKRKAHFTDDYLDSNA